MALCAGGYGLTLAQSPTDTDLINQYAARYVANAPTGAALTDCTGRPGQGERVRLIVDCAHPKGTSTQFLVGPQGQFVPHFRVEG